MNLKFAEEILCWNTLGWESRIERATPTVSTNGSFGSDGYKVQTALARGGGSTGLTKDLKPIVGSNYLLAVLEMAREFW